LVWQIMDAIEGLCCRNSGGLYKEQARGRLTTASPLLRPGSAHHIYLGPPAEDCRADAGSLRNGRTHV